MVKLSQCCSSSKEGRTALGAKVQDVSSGSSGGASPTKAAISLAKADLRSKSLPRDTFLDGMEASLCAALERKMLEAQVKIGVGSSQSSVLEDAVREAMGSALRTLEEHAPHWLFITATDNYDSEGGLHAIVAMCKDLIQEFCASGAGTDAEETETQFHATTTCRAVLNDRQGFVSASPAGDREATQGCALGIFCIWNPRHVLEAARPPAPENAKRIRNNLARRARSLGKRASEGVRASRLPRISCKRRL